MAKAVTRDCEPIQGYFFRQCPESGTFRLTRQREALKFDARTLRAGVEAGAVRFPGIRSTANTVEVSAKWSA